jgi:hypothetical protein
LAYFQLCGVPPAKTIFVKPAFVWVGCGFQEIFVFVGVEEDKAQKTGVWVARKLV